MVAEMASCGAACHLEDGDGDIPAPENKDPLAESDSSSSENAGTSTEESSEEDDEDEEEGGDSASLLKVGVVLSTFQFSKAKQHFPLNVELLL
ncbi:unnamed protein product [Pleuronectes platessa]|uniref:Uncharacterized protein n=1 Tax=Pleuronectes platessa TaxID=8262 RepID=A0A9N7YHY5_PLEPL|nr:unnamed protein product [Pleuronectes platessa]